MTNAAITKLFNDNTIRVVTGPDGEPWLVAADVCAVLDISNVGNALARLDRADIRSTDVRSGGQRRSINIVNESGLYDLILDSRKPIARAFRRWVTSELLPEIRRDGTYIPDQLSDWQRARAIGKIERRSFTDVIKDQLAATDDPDNRWYSNLTRLVKRFAGVTAPRDELTAEQLARVAEIEGMLAARLGNRSFDSMREAYADSKRVLEAVYA